MVAAQQASQLQTSDDAYQQIFQRGAPRRLRPKSANCRWTSWDSFFYGGTLASNCTLPSSSKPLHSNYKEEGLLIRIIVRRIPGTDRYEITGWSINRVEAAKISGWTRIGAEIVEADGRARAITIATVYQPDSAART